MPTIAEVRQKFPQYADLSDDQLAQGLHKKYYSDLPFDEFSKKIGLDTKEASKPAERPTDALRMVGLGGRAAAEGVVNTLASPLDMPEQLIAPIRNAIGRKLGLPDMPDMTISGLFRKGMDAAGAQNAETSGENYLTAGVRGLTGALTAGGLGSVATPAAAVRTGLAGTTGALSSEAARQHGLGQGAQFVAGLAGGLAPAALEELARVGARTVANVARPLTRSGQEQIAANVMAKQAIDPQAAAQNLENAQPVVPGSLRTTGEASGDVGLLALEKGVRGTNPAPFSQRLSEQNAARQNELQQLGGAPADIATASKARDAVTTPMREAALATEKQVANAPILQHIDDVLASPVGERQVVKRALGEFRDQLEGKTDPSRLYEIRKDINDAMLGKLGGDKAVYALARKELGGLKGVIDNEIEKTAPGFKAYLDRYKDMSKPVDQMKIIQQIKDRAEINAADISTGQDFLGNAPFARALDSAMEKSGGKLTSDQVERLNAIRTDLQYGQAINGPLVKAPGSDTFQNLSIAQVIGSGATSAHPALRALSRPLDWVYKIAGTDTGVKQILTDAMLDPHLAASMLRKATPRSVQSFSEALRLRTLQNASGLAGGLNSTLSQPSGSTDTIPAPQ